MKQFVTRSVLAAAFVCAAGAPRLTAGALSFASGNTQPRNPGSISGTIDFAVFRNTGAVGDVFGTGAAGFDALFSPGTGSAALDTTASYLYVYETVATGPENGNGIFENTVAITPSLSTSFGAFQTTAFSTDVLGTAAGYGNPSAASLGATPVVNSGVGGVVQPTFVQLGSTSLKAFYYADLVNGQKSTLWGYTSNAGPTLASTAIIEAGGANGTAVQASRNPTLAAVPEPSTFSLIGLGLGMAAVIARKARRA